MFRETICALSSAPGQAGVSIIRISGNHAKEVLNKYTNVCSQIKPRYAKLTKIINPWDKDVVDTGLVIWFPGPASYTGEDLLEFHVHGSIAVVNCLLNSLIKFKGIRLAEAGEFSKRAFYNNKMDLTQIEGIGDLIKAETEMQRKQATSQVNGLLKRSIKQWQEKLIECITNLEAFIEFNDTDGVDLNFMSLHKEISLVRDNLSLVLKRSKRSMLLQQGVGVAIYGMPNAGKSSLFNVLVNSERALVSNVAGTTRDIIEAPLNIAGFRTNLIDTAGLRTDIKCGVEELGVKKATDTLFNDTTVIHILVFPADVLVEMAKSEKNLVNLLIMYIDTFSIPGLVNENAKTIKELFKKPTLIVINKKDLISSQVFDEFDSLKENAHFVSCTSNSGIDEFILALEQCIKNSFNGNHFSAPYCTTIRQTEAISACTEILGKVLEDSIQNRDFLDYPIIVEHLKLALQKLNFLVGSCYKDEILTRIFENFCIGK